jgi:hypothetical protein
MRWSISSQGNWDWTVKTHRLNPILGFLGYVDGRRQHRLQVRDHRAQLRVLRGTFFIRRALIGHSTMIDNPAWSIEAGICGPIWPRRD